MVNDLSILDEIEDMVARNLNPHTQRSISGRRRFATWLNRSPRYAVAGTTEGTWHSGCKTSFCDARKPCPKLTDTRWS
jgi:hypothetical protein